MAAGTRSNLAAPRPLGVLVHVNDGHVARWLDRELGREPVMVQLARTMEHVVSALVDDPEPRPEILVVHFDGLGVDELFALRKIRDDGWQGVVIATTRHVVPYQLRQAIGIDHVVPAPFVQDALRDLVIQTREGARAALATPPLPADQGLPVCMILTDDLDDAEPLARSFADGPFPAETSFADLV
jgi:hypothetical protein